MGNAPPKLTPKEQLKVYQKELKRAIRSLEREQRELERNQGKIAVDIRKAAKEGQMVRLKLLMGVKHLLARGEGGEGDRVGLAAAAPAGIWSTPVFHETSASCCRERAQLARRLPSVAHALSCAGASCRLW